MGNHAIAQAANAVQALDLMSRISELLEESTNDPGEYVKNKAYAEEIAIFGRDQAAKGSPYLYCLCAVNLWAHLEVLVDDLVVAAMRNPMDCPDQKALGKIKGSLIDFLMADPDGQAELLAETFKQVVDAPLKQGVGKFESLLAPIGLGGGADKVVGQTLYELGQIRNVIMHKGGRADRRLLQACPWLKMQKGDIVDVDSKRFDMYFAGVVWYFLEIHARVIERYDGARTKESDEAQIGIINRLKELSSGADY